VLTTMTHPDDTSPVPTVDWVGPGLGHAVQSNAVRGDYGAELHVIAYSRDTPGNAALWVNDASGMTFKVTLGKAALEQLCLAAADVLLLSDSYRSHPGPDDDEYIEVGS
jgi:hypothetical protein